jgi:hypothetical protein
VRRRALCIAILASTLGGCGAAQHGKIASGSSTKALTELAYSAEQAGLRCEPVDVAVVNRHGEKTCRKMTPAELFHEVMSALARCPSHTLLSTGRGSVGCARSKK